MIILGIETSCDDTGIAIVKAEEHKSGRTSFKILSNIVSSQVKIHAKYGGIVPNLASREHLKNIKPCLRQAFNEAKIKQKDIDLIAVTVGPGLIPSLLIGTHFAKTLSYVWKKPIIGINHLEGHILASVFDSQFSTLKQLLPVISLIVSGGHTQLILMNDIGKYKIIGETKDDAAGECFDKIARLLGLSYPGGPSIAAQAIKYKAKNLKTEIKLPRPMIKQKNYDFSFSGLKTAVLYLVKKLEAKNSNKNKSKSPKLKPQIISAICAEAQQAIIDVLIEKTIRAAEEYRARTIILSGGVAANNELRKQLKLNIKHRVKGAKFLIPPKNLCTDNAVMIAVAGFFRYKLGVNTSWKKIKADANLKIK